MKIRDWRTGGGYLRGVDVSAYQGNINYSKLKSNGIKYAILRAYGSSSSPDRRIVEYAQGFKNVGIPCGSYFFCTISNEYDLASARSQANSYATKLEQAFGSGSWGQLTPFIDLEGNENVGGRHKSLNTTAMLNWVHEFRKTFEARFGNKVKLGIYTSWYFIYDHNNFNHGRTSAGNILKDMPLWMAKWRTTSINDVGGWTNWVLWQYTDNAYPFSSGYVAGVSSAGLDMNYTESLDDLRTIGTGTTTPTEEEEPTLNNARVVKASLQTNHSIQVVWNKSLSANIQKQVLYRNSVVYKTFDKNVESFNDKDVEFGEQYYYTVRTYDKEMWVDSDPSNIVKTKLPAPSTPTGLVVTPSDRGLTVTWTPNELGEGVTSYTLYVDGIKYDKANKTEYTFKGLAIGSEYSFSVQAHNENPSPSPISNTVTGIPIMVLPEVPTNLQVGVKSNKEIHLSWEHYQDDRFSHYSLTVNGLLVATGLKSKAYVFKGLGTNIDYTFSVIVYDLDGDSIESETVTTRMNEPTKVVNLKGRSFDRRLEFEWDFATFVPNPTAIAEVEENTEFEELDPPFEDVPEDEVLVYQPIGEPVPVITDEELDEWEEEVEVVKPVEVQPKPAPIPPPPPPPPPKYSLVSYSKMKENALALTSYFETSRSAPQCFGITAGNFDGAGVSHGAIQYNLGSGTLQPILNELMSKHRELVKVTWGYYSNPAYFNSLKNMLASSKSSQVSWGNNISNPSNKHKLKEPYATYFYNLGITAEARALQVKYTESYFTQGKRHFDKFGLWSRRGFALCFDIAVQSWSISSSVESKIFADFNKIVKTGKSSAQIETEKLVIITNRRADAVSSTWRSVWRDRKMAIAKGSGWVYNNSLFMDTRKYDMVLEPAFADNIPADLK